MTDLNCQVIAPAAQNAVSSALDSMARDAGEAAARLIGLSLTWWIDMESVNPDSAAVRNLQQYTLPIALAMLVGSVLVQSLRMTLSRSKDPAINVGLGLIRYAVVTSLGLGVLALALRAGDGLSSWLVTQGVGDFAQRMQELFGAGDTADDTGAVLTTVFPGSLLMLIVGLIGVLLGLIQWILAFFRQAGILVLAVMLPLAASGSINDSTRVWMNRLVPWLLALVAYKPMAAMIYTIGMTFMGDGQDFETVLTGLMVMVLAALAMPAMLRFFAWSQVAATGGSGTAASLAAGASAVASMASLRSARGMELTGPGSSAAQGSSSSTPSGRGGPGSAPGGGSSGGGLAGPSGGSGSPDSSGNRKDDKGGAQVAGASQPSGSGASGSPGAPVAQAGSAPAAAPAAGTGAAAPATGSAAAPAAGAGSAGGAASGAAGGAAGAAAGGAVAGQKAGEFVQAGAEEVNKNFGAAGEQQ